MDDIPGICHPCPGSLGKRNRQTGRGQHPPRLCRNFMIDVDWVTGEGCGVPSTVTWHGSFFVALPILYPHQPLAQPLLLTDIIIFHR